MKAFLIFQKLLLVNLLFLISIDSGYCGDYTWKASPSDNDWSNYNNWSPTPIAAFSSSDNIIIVSSSKEPIINSNQTIGKLTISSGSLTINSSFSLNVTNTVSIAGGTTINGQGQLNINQISSLGTTIGNSSSGATINCSVHATVGALTLRNSIFGSNSTVIFKVTTGGASYNIGGNEFNGPTTFESAGASGLRLSDLGEDKFNNDLTLISTVALIYASYNYSTEYKGNIIVKSSGNSGVYFGNNSSTSTTTSTLSNSKTITAQDFTSGTLTLKNFIQDDTLTPQSIILDSIVSAGIEATGKLTFTGNCVFKGILTAKSPNLEISGGTYYNSSTFTKTGASNTASSGSAIFKNDVVFNSNSGIWYICYNNPSNYVFEGNATFNKNSANLFSIAHNLNALAQFTKPDKTIIINNGGGSGSIAIAASGAIESSGKMIFRSNSAEQLLLGEILVCLRLMMALN